MDNTSERTTVIIGVSTVGCAVISTIVICGTIFFLSGRVTALEEQTKDWQQERRALEQRIEDRAEQISVETTCKLLVETKLVKNCMVLNTKPKLVHKKRWGKDVTTRGNRE